MKKIKYMIGMLSLSMVCFMTGCGNSVTINGNNPETITQKETSQSKKSDKTKKKETDTDSGKEENTKDEDETPGSKEKTSQISDNELTETRYFDFEGNPVYKKQYTYYENGLVCSENLCAYNYYENVETGETEKYTTALYTILFLYNEAGELEETILDCVTLPDYYHEETGAVTINIDYKEDGTSEETVIYPLEEDIEQEKFGVDATQTVKMFGNPFVFDRTKAEHWAETYLKQAFSEEPVSDWMTCSFFYIDDDDVPELWVNSNYGYAGAALYTCDREGTKNDKIECYWGIINCQEGEDLFWESAGHTGMYEDRIYRIKNGKFELQGNGEYSYEFAGATPDSEPVSHYYWNGEEVTEEAYKKSLQESIDAEQCVMINEKNNFSYKQVQTLLQYLVSNSD